MRFAILRWVFLFLAAYLLVELALGVVQDIRYQGWAISTAPAVILTAFLTVPVTVAAELIREDGVAPFPWEPASPARHGRLLSARRQPRVILNLVAAGMIGALGLTFVRAPVPEYTVENAESSMLMLWGLGLGLLYTAVRLFLRPRSRAARSAAETRQGDLRDPILFLRSFDDDDLSVRIHGSWRQPYVAGLLGRTSERFEVMLCWHYGRLAP